MHGIDSVWLAVHHSPPAGGDGWVGVVGLWVAVAELIVTLAGPVRKWWARRARKAKFYVAQLGRIMEDLDAAIDAGDLRAIRFHLCRWRRLAARVYGVLMDAKPDDDQVLRCMRTSMRLARVAGAALVSDDESAVTAYMAARNAINAAFDVLNIWVSRRHR
jgi:hypothetical protein